MQTSTEKFSLVEFIKEVRAELKKVHWPTKAELASYTVTVLLTTLVVSLCIFGIDKVITTLLQMIIGS